MLEVIAGGSVQHCMMDAHPLLRKDAAVGIDISGGIIYIVLLELSVDPVDWRRRCLLRETCPPLASRPAEPAKVAIQLLRIHDLCRRDDGGEDKITWHDEWRRTCVHVQSTQPSAELADKEENVAATTPEPSRAATAQLRPQLFSAARHAS